MIESKIRKILPKINELIFEYFESFLYVSNKAAQPKTPTRMPGNSPKASPKRPKKLL